MSKIANLEVDTIKFAPGALTGSVRRPFYAANGATGSFASMTLPTSGAVMLFWSCFIAVSGHSSGPIPYTNEVRVEIRRTSGVAKVFYNNIRSRSGTVVTDVWSGSALDVSPGANPTYNVYIRTSGNPGIATAEGTLNGVYFKK